MYIINIYRLKNMSRYNQLYQKYQFSGKNMINKANKKYHDRKNI